MPQQHYRCPACGVLELMVYRAADTDLPTWPPTCTTCPSMRMEMAPQEMRLDLKTDGAGDRSFQKFTTYVDGQPVEIDSLYKLRKVERESEQRYLNGEGEPIRFRMWNQESSNRDVSAFGEAGTVGSGTSARTYDSGTPLQKSGKVSIRRHGEDKPKVTLGPGMTKAAAGVA